MADREAMFKYLDKLQESAETNMMGAGSYLEREFGLEREEAREVLFAWMDSYPERHPRVED